ncbi:MAG TPA: carboxypeptidase regulatory-like domain-containing protein [Vicinamibacterales bacterium]|nr:carboxypeptidase regulatory-like domain-containing protein [Vicinamibacterales bacterium]
MFSVRVRRCTLVLLLLLTPAVAFAQQTGSIQGKVADTSGAVLPGVTVEAKSNVLPSARATVSGSDGVYLLPQLPPGHYTITFTLSGFQATSREADVHLEQVTTIDMKLAVQGVSEAVTVTAETGYADKTSAAITSGLKSTEIDRLPVGTQYRDLINLIPGVMYTQDATRGPSAGASGQDNVYNFDGVNVTLPLFGTLSAEPSSLDIAQFTVVKGGATAIDFNRAGGFNIDSVSKSGTNKFSGEAQFRFQTHTMAANQVNTNSSKYDEDRYWTDVNGGGPIVPSKAFFYASYYRPTVTRQNASNAYGDLPDYNSTRNEGFGKVTLTPTSSTLVNVSYRNSHRLDTGSTFGPTTAATAGAGAESHQRIATADASWIINASNFLTFKYTHFENPTAGRPDHVATASPSSVIGSHLDTSNLATIGALLVPKIGSNTSVNSFIQPIINQYGFACTAALAAAGTCPTAGIQAGGGTVGYNSLFDRDDFYRDAGQIAYNSTLTALGMRHNLHAGYQQYIDSEDLDRSSNGFGVISVPAGAVSFPAGTGPAIFYQATLQAQGVGTVPVIHSEYHSRSFEGNDAINWKNVTFNVGAVVSNDNLYGQGLRPDASAPSGFVSAVGNKYKEYEIPFSKMIQPRVSATWAYNDKDTVYASYARYNPAASSLPRAASWDRGLEVTQNFDYDTNGNLFAIENVASSTGKLFVADMTPKRYDEFLVGTAKQFNSTLSGRVYFRYRKGTHFWEDTPNMARILYNEGHTTVPGTSASIPQTPYIADLATKLAAIGNGGGNAYVIADLDGSFTDYRELTLESEYRKGPAWVQGSFTWSRYYGNFDQDASASLVASSLTDNNDSNIFIGSSNIGDGPGRQLWDNKLGYLRGDRPYSLKLMGTYTLKWNGSVGAFVTAQSGQPWETHSFQPYSSLTGSTSNTARYAEPAGSHRSDPHTQLDLNYTQELPFLQRYRAGLVFYLYNVFDSQTGYSIDYNFNDALYGQPLRYYDPRRLEMTVRFRF